VTAGAQTAGHSHRQHHECGKAAGEPGDGQVAMGDRGFVPERCGRGIGDLMHHEHTNGAQKGRVKSLHPFECRSAPGRSDVTRGRLKARSLVTVGLWEATRVAPSQGVAPSPAVERPKGVGRWTGRHGFVVAPFPRSTSRIQPGT